jgi:hypothetical protein
MLPGLFAGIAAEDNGLRSTDLLFTLRAGGLFCGPG